MIWGGRCPYCKEPFRGLKDGKTMGSHRAPWYPLGGGRRRETCPYSGATREDAERRITPLMRRTQRYIVSQGLPMKPESRDLLEKRGMLEETLKMMSDPSQCGSCTAGLPMPCRCSEIEKEQG